MSQLKDKLMFVLNKWEKTQYDSDQQRWQEYAVDISDLAASLVDDPGHEGTCEEVHAGIEHDEWKTQQGG